MLSQLALALLLAGVLAAHLHHLARGRARVKQASQAAEAAAILAVVPDARDVSKGTAGVATFAGAWRGQRAQVATIVDTLATRKLPAKWLSVSITEPVSIDATVDFMIRPGSATTFSNFDLLEYTLAPFPGLPPETVIRSDKRNARPPGREVLANAGFLRHGRAKELLITPKGVRIVWLLAEADRLRYGVFRQAEFGDSDIDPELVDGLLGAASDLRAAINRCALQAA